MTQLQLHTARAAEPAAPPPRPGPTLGSPTVQRQRRRQQNLRYAEHLDELASAYRWWAETFLPGDPDVTPGSARARVAGELREMLDRAAKAAAAEACSARERAAAITVALTKAGRA